MGVAAQLITNGLIAGSIYALMAAGFSLMYSIQRFINIAHGATYLTGAFIAYAAARLWGMPLWLSFFIGIVAATILGIVINYCIYEPLQRQKNKERSLLMASFGVFLVIEAAILMTFGSDVKTFGLPVKQGMDILGATITPLQIIIIVLAPIVFGALWLFFQTKLGTALRATSDNETIAKTMGINVRVMTILSTGLGSALAGLAGILVGLEQNVTHSMGLAAVLKGFAAAIIAGIGNVPAALLGGLFLGLVENIGIWYLPSGYKDAIAFALLLLFLLFRPQGILGQKKREEAGG